ncbi:MAG: LLM class F420-dependent oxidoreductase [Nocardioides sp.]
MDRGGYGSDAVSILGHLAAHTERIRLGTAIMQIPARPATTTAMAAATQDNLSEGRFTLGLGLSGPQVLEGWYGTAYGRQLQRTREYVEVVRMALARERVAFDGETIQLPLADGPGKALKLTIGPVQERLPVFLASIGPRNVELTGEIADGWIPTFFSPEHVGLLSAPLREGAERAGRDVASIAVCPQVLMFIDDDIDVARDAVRPALALYIGGMGSRAKNFYVDLMTRYGFREEARGIQDLYLAGRKEEAAAAIPSDLIDMTSLVGPEDVVQEQLARYESVGVDTLIVVPMVQGAVAQGQQITKLRSVGQQRFDDAGPTDVHPTGAQVWEGFGRPPLTLRIQPACSGVGRV